MVEYISDLAMTFIGSFGLISIFILMALESACIPIPSEVIMPFAGASIAIGTLKVENLNKPTLLILAVLAGTFGCLAGSILAYAVGAKGGRPLLLKYGKYILITEKKLDTSDNFFNKYGEKAIFWSRLMPIVRTFISLPAGISKMNFLKFSIYSTIGSLPWCLALGYVGYALGQHWEVIRPYFKILDIIVGLAIIGMVVYGVLKYRKKKIA